MGEKQNVPAGPEKQPLSSPPPRDDGAQGSRDLRIIIVIGLVLAVLVAAYLYNRFTSVPEAGPETAATGQGTGDNLDLFNTSGASTPPQSAAPQQQSGPPASLTQRYRSLLHNEQLKMASFLYFSGDQTYVVGSPPRQMQQGNRTALVMGWLFNLTHHAEGVALTDFQRRTLGEQLIYAENIPVIGNELQLKPRFQLAGELGPETDAWPAVCLVHNGEARAYPTRILNYHEIIKDTVGGEPIVVEWNAWSYGGAALVARSDKADASLQFMASGLMYRGDDLMYDRATHSLWAPSLGECITGELAGAKLQAVPVVITTIGYWKSVHPESQVLMGADPALEGIKYDEAPMLPREDYYTNPDGYPAIMGYNIQDTRLPPKAVVFGVVVDGTARAYALADLRRLAAEKPLQDVVNGKTISVVYDAKGGFVVIKDADGNVLPGLRMFWLFWSALHPQTDVYGRTNLAAEPPKTGAEPKPAPETMPGKAAPETGGEPAVSPAPGK